MRLTSPISLYRVAGTSMQPTYQPGDTLLGWRWLSRRCHPPRVGRVVVASWSGRLIIKRLAARDSAGVTLRGDNPTASTDSREFGELPISAIAAVIIWRLP